MKFAVIGSFFGRHEASLPLLKRLYVDSTRKPDEAWLVCETDDDQKALESAWWTLYEHEMYETTPGLTIETVPTPRTAAGKPEVIPYAHAINWALDRTTADAVVYLDNGSVPWITKYELMADGLEQNPGWGACYVGQKRTGYVNETFHAGEVVENAYCRLNFTQVMHRVTADRWPLDMRYANPDTADGEFWGLLHKRYGAFYPVGVGEILDEHHMPGAHAAGAV